MFLKSNATIFFIVRKFIPHFESVMSYF